jgi:release factor glutamine methyltransferase
MRVDEVLQNASAALSAISDSPRLDAEIILAHMLNQSRSYLRAHTEYTLSVDEERHYASFIARRLQGEPVAYLTGHQEFWSLDLRVNHSTLIPKPNCWLRQHLHYSLTKHSTLKQ